MKNYFFCYLLLLLSLSQENTDQLSAVVVTHSFPIIDSFGKVVAYEDDSVVIYQKANFAAYRFSYYVDSVVQNVSGSIVHNKIISLRKAYQYAIRQGNNEYSFIDDNRIYRYDPGEPLDSILLKNSFWMNSRNLYSSLFTNKLILKSSSETLEGNILDVYSFMSIKDTTQTATIFFEFARDFPQTSYSLSPELDSLKGMKLIKTRILNHARFIKEYNLHIDEISSYLFELKPFPVADDDRIFLLLKKIEQIK